MLHSKIIDDLSDRFGGQQKLAAMVGMHNSTICHWKDDGIPARHWPRILEIAKAAAYPLTLEQINRHSPLRRTAKPVRTA